MNRLTPLAPLAALTAVATTALLLGPSQVALAKTDDAALTLPPSLAGKTIRRLTLQETLAIAIRRNLGIRIQSEQVAISKSSLRASEAGFEPTVNASISHSDSLYTPATSVDGDLGQVFKSKSQAWSVTLGKRLQAGTKINLTFTSSRKADNSGSAVDPLFYGTNLDISISQPLLRGFSLDTDIPRAVILRAQFSSQRALEQKRIVIASQVLRTEDVYWNLARATRAYAVQVASLHRATEQLSLTNRQIAAGILAPADKITSESSIAQRELDLVVSESQLASAMDSLRSELNLPPNQWGEPLLAIDLPEVSGEVISMSQAVDLAIKQRPEMQQNRLDLQSQALERRTARNSKLPNLDLGLAYGLSGQGAAYQGSLTQLKGLGARNWRVFMNLSWSPLGQAARERVVVAQSQDRIRMLNHEQFLVRLRIEVRAAVRNLQTAKLRVRASERARQLAEQSLEVERQRFLGGKSRNLDVSLREEAVASAETAELSARISFLKARSALDYATGSLLSAKKINLSVAK